MGSETLERSAKLRTAIEAVKRAGRNLRAAAIAEGLAPCDDEGGDRCNFPECIVYGCEPELAEKCAASPPASTPGDAAGEARCPKCEHLFDIHADDGSGCLKDCGPEICPCRRARPASRTAPGAGTVESIESRAIGGNDSAPEQNTGVTPEHRR